MSRGADSAHTPPPPPASLERVEPSAWFTLVFTQAKETEIITKEKTKEYEVFNQMEQAEASEVLFHFLKCYCCFLNACSYAYVTRLGDLTPKLSTTQTMLLTITLYFSKQFP